MLFRDSSFHMVGRQIISENIIMCRREKNGERKEKGGGGERGRERERGGNVYLLLLGFE
jgi:hypothetical protein